MIESEMCRKKNVWHIQLESVHLFHIGRIGDMQNALRLRTSEAVSLAWRSGDSSLTVRTMCRTGNLMRNRRFACVQTRGVITALRSIRALP